MNIRKYISIGAAALVTTASFALSDTGTAHADPRGGDTLVLSCDRLGQVEVIVFSAGTWSAALVDAGNRVLVPYELHFTGTFMPTVGEPQSFTEHHVKPAPRNGRTDHCTFHQEGGDPSGTFEVDGDVWVSYTPRP